jgi:hypothetical protein
MWGKYYYVSPHYVYFRLELCKPWILSYGKHYTGDGLMFGHGGEDTVSLCKINCGCQALLPVSGIECEEY